MIGRWGIKKYNSKNRIGFKKYKDQNSIVAKACKEGLDYWTTLKEHFLEKYKFPVMNVKSW